MKKLLLAVLMLAVGTAHAVPKDTHFFFDPARLSPGALPPGVTVSTDAFVLGHNDLIDVTANQHHIPTVNTDAESKCTGTNILEGSGACVANAGGAHGNGANCSAGSAPLGVDANGAVEGCFDVATQAEIEAIIASTSTISLLKFNAINKDGTDISLGEVVYISGSTDLDINIKRAKGDTDTTSVVAGLVSSVCVKNTLCEVTRIGVVENLDTSAFSQGTIVHLSTLTPGALVAGHNIGPGFDVIVGVVKKNGGANGSIYVSPHPHITVGLGAANQIRAMVSAADEETYKTLIAGTNVSIINTDTSITISATVGSIMEKTKAELQAEACATYPGTRCIRYNTSDDDLYTSTGSFANQWRNTRTGQGP